MPGEVVVRKVCDSARARALRVIGVLALGLGLNACASVERAAQPEWWNGKEQQMWDMPSILARHPDVLHRKLGFMHEHDGDLASAAREFRLAAGFADKPSQAMLAEMYFAGRGVPRDPVLAYAWMDLAAERGYRNLLARREHYWNTLDAAQRREALQQGQQLYAQYSDTVAKPRIEKILNLARQRLYLGSRGRAAGVAVVNVFGPQGLEWFPGQIYFDDRYWKPDNYYAWTDEIYGGQQQGQVDVGPLAPAPDEAVKK